MLCAVCEVALLCVAALCCCVPLTAAASGAASEWAGTATWRARRTALYPGATRGPRSEYRPSAAGAENVPQAKNSLTSRPLCGAYPFVGYCSSFLNKLPLPKKQDWLFRDRSSSPRTSAGH